MLISSIVGISQRSTMDLDATIRKLTLTEESIKNAFETICSVNVDDGIQFSFNYIEPIRDNDEYGGYRVSFFASLGKINTPISMDISTGDIVTPDAEIHLFSDMFDDTVKFELWSYPIETILAEKVETILSRGVDNTRPRDFYDVYMLTKFDYDSNIFFDAFFATSIHRGSIGKTEDYRSIINNILNNKEMNERWISYSSLMPYVNGISFSETIDALLNLMNKNRQ